MDSPIATTKGLRSVLNTLMPVRTTTGIFHAFKTDVQVKLKKTLSVNFNFEHIDPGYRTLGSLFFQNDLENYTIGLQTSFFKKINLSGNLGVQRNNLSSESLNSSSRVVGMVNASVPVSNRINVNVSFSNFSTTSIIISPPTDPALPIISTQLAQISRNGSINWSFIANKNRTSVITGLFSIQQAYAIQNEVVVSSQFSTLYMGNLSYNYTLQKHKLTLMSSLLVNKTQSAYLQTTNIAPTLSARKKLLDGKLNIATQITYNTSITPQYTSGVFVANLTSGITLLKKHNLGFQCRFTSRQGNPTINQPGFKEFSGNLTYGWNFL